MGEGGEAMRIVRITDRQRRIFEGIELADMLKARIRQGGTWQDRSALGVHWMEYCRFFRLFGCVYLCLDVSQRAARRCFRRALRKKPQDAHTLAAIGNTYMRERQYAKALPYFERAFQSAPTGAYYAWRLLAALYLLGQYAQVLQRCEEAIPTVQDAVIACWMRLTAAFAALQNGDRATATAHLTQLDAAALLEMEDGNAAFWSLLEALCCSGQWEKARTLYAKHRDRLTPYDTPCQGFLAGEGASGKWDADACGKTLRAFRPIGLQIDEQPMLDAETACLLRNGMV